MQTQLGLVHFWQQGDLVTHATAILLLLLSIGSWALIVGRFARQLRINLACDRAPEAFWQARNLNDALAAIDAADRTGLFAGMARAGAHARDSYDSESGLGAGVSLSEALTRGLRNRMLAAQASLETGLTFLASVGSTAPFIGLFGTVWGICPWRLPPNPGARPARSAFGGRVRAARGLPSTLEGRCAGHEAHGRQQRTITTRAATWPNRSRVDVFIHLSSGDPPDPDRGFCHIGSGGMTQATEGSGALTPGEELSQDGLLLVLRQARDVGEDQALLSVDVRQKKGREVAH